MEGGVQHAAAALGARIQAADTGGLYRRSAKPNFATHGYDLNSHTRGGLRTQFGRPNPDESLVENSQRMGFLERTGFA